MNKILLTFANAEADLNLKEEITSLFDVTDLHLHAQVITKTQADLDKITDTFRNHPDISIFHFGGHASSEAIALEKNGKTQYAFMEGLTSYLGKQEHLQVVFLNGCETQAQAEALINKDVSYVIATDKAIENSVAIEFSKCFYSEIAKNQSVTIAYENAKFATATRYKTTEQTYQKGLKLKIRNDKGFPWKLFKNPNATEWHIKSPSKQLAAYYEKIKEYYQIHALNEKEAKLSDLYIIPDFKIHRRCYDATADFDKEGFQEVETNIHDFVLDTFLQKNTNNYKNCKAENARLMVLLGQPGQGKSSFCARVIHDFLKDDRYRFDKKLYFLRLRDLPRPKDFMAQPIETLKAIFEKKKIDLHLDNALLILDGLDELSMSAGLTHANIKELINDIHRMLEKEFTDLHCIITSRYNYFNIKDINGQKTWLVKLNELTEIQQINWLNKYQYFNPNTKLSEAKIKEINNEENKNFKHIRELINQPILLHLIAKLEFEIDSRDNRAAIYTKLFDTLGKQSWNPDALDRYKEGFEEELREYISTLAYQVYISDFEYIKRKEIEGLPETRKFKENCLQTTTSLDEGLKEVLVSFYFKNSQKEKDDDFEKDRNDYALEFMHKSLQEYLTAEYIWTTIKEEFLDKNRRDDYIIDTWNAALETIWDLSHHQRLTEEIHDYLIEIIQNDITTNKKELADRMSLFLEDLLRHQFIYKYEASEKNHSPIEKGVTCFYVYWQVLAQLQMKEVEGKVENPNYITEEIKEGFAIMLKLAGSYQYYGINLSGQDLQKINLNHWIGLKAVLRSADLRSADLSSADLRSADLRYADLSFAVLRSADLSYADLSFAVLSYADLRSADLSFAVLRYADLRYADLSKAYLIRRP